MKRDKSRRRFNKRRTQPPPTRRQREDWARQLQYAMNTLAPKEVSA